MQVRLRRGYGQWLASGGYLLLLFVGGEVDSMAGWRVIAGLVAITPACGFVGVMGGMVIGLLAGVICLWGVNGLKHMIGADDSLDVFGVHGIGGALGAILTAHELMHRTQDRAAMWSARWLLAMAFNASLEVAHVFGHHRDVGLVAQQALQHDCRIVDRELEGERRRLLLQGRHDRHDVVGAVGGDPQVPSSQGLFAGQQCLGLVLNGKQPGGDALQLPSGLGGDDLPATPVEQAHAIGLLECGHLAREIGLAEARIARRRGERAGLGNEMEGAELAGCHIHETDS
mgnify:CR=1 FL=1